MKAQTKTVSLDRPGVDAASGTIRVWLEEAGIPLSRTAGCFFVCVSREPVRRHPYYLFGFALDEGEMAAIAALDRGEKHDWY